MLKPATQNSSYTRVGRLPSGLWQVTCRLDDAHPDGVLVERPGSDAHVLWRALPSEKGTLRVELADFAASSAPAVWFVQVDEPRSSPAAVSLVAFANDRMPPGTVINKYQFASMGVSNDDQAAAIRWYSHNGLVHQVFVGEAWRRRHLATVMLYAASAVHQANGWSGRLHGDGRRTELGERLVAGIRHPERIQPLAEKMPPMDPS